MFQYTFILLSFSKHLISLTTHRVLEATGSPRRQLPAWKQRLPPALPASPEVQGRQRGGHIHNRHLARGCGVSETHLNKPFALILNLQRSFSPHSPTGSCVPACSHHFCSGASRLSPRRLTACSPAFLSCQPQDFF